MKVIYLEKDQVATLQKEGKVTVSKIEGGIFLGSDVLVKHFSNDPGVIATITDMSQGSHMDRREINLKLR